MDQVRAAVLFAMEVSCERFFVDVPDDARFFIRLPRGGRGSGRIAVHSPLGESPSSGSGTYQKEFQGIVISFAVADCSYNDSLGLAKPCKEPFGDEAIFAFAQSCEPNRSHAASEMKSSAILPYIRLNR
ncbi:MAG TPA: hypothetical protein VMU24_11460 [Candidatus Acidoferrales bacterium]|nr:hypothetical protein [Candidatus Acidoferrales bacterium]